MIAVVAVLALAFAALALVPADYDDGADDKEVVHLNGVMTAAMTGTENQRVIVDKDLLITVSGDKKGQVTILGDFIVNQGVTVTIEGVDAFLRIEGDATIDGDVISKTKNGLLIIPNGYDGKSVVINGSVSSYGDGSAASIVAVTVSGDVTVNGVFNVGTNTKVTITSMTFAEKSQMNVYGAVNGTIKLSGNAYFESNDKNNTNSAMFEFGTAFGSVEVKKVYGDVYVYDDQMYAYTYGGEQYYVAYDESAGTAEPLKRAVIGDDGTSEFGKLPYTFVRLRDIANVKVTEKVTTEVKYDDEDSMNKMVAKVEMRIESLDVQKDVENADSTVAAGASIYTSNGVFDTMTLYSVSVTVSGKATVIGTITYPLQPVPTIVFKVDNELDVSGSVIIMKTDSGTGGITGTGKIIAAHYAAKGDDNKYTQYYTSLKNAIAADAKDITMLGQLIVEEDLTIPAGVKLITDPALSTSPGLKHEQCPVFVKEDATLTIADGAQFNTKGDLDIEGTFVIENIDYGITLKGIWADVQMKDGSRVMYTNIYNAFAKAEAGAELSAYNPVNGKIVIDEDLTVPAGMSFSNEGIAYSTFDKMKTIEIGKAVTLTVAGKLIIDAPDKLAAESSFGTESTEVSGGEVTENAVVKIGPQGLIQFDDANGTAVQGADIYESKRIAGAYFNDSPSSAADMKLCIANIPLALAGILDANDNYVKIYGEVEISDIKVAGTEKDRAKVTLSQYADVIMKNFTFAYASVTAEAGAKLTGDIGTATGKMILNKASVVVEATFNEIFVNDSMNLEVSGLIKSDNATEIAGIIYLKGFAYSILSESGSPEYKILTYAEKKFLVPAGTAAFVEGEVTFFGDIELHIAGELTVMRDAFLYSMGNTSVTGTLTIDKVDGHAGTALFPVMYIGGTTDSFGDYVAGPAGNALVTGAGSVSSLNKQIIYLFNGATVSADVLNDWMDDAKSIQFYVDGSVWMTAYCGIKLEAAFASYDPVNDTTTYNAVPVLDNAKFNSWQTYDEKTNTYADVIPDKENEGIYYAVVGDARYDKVYANIDRSIYDVTIIADMGVDDIFIDGKIILKDKTSNTFTEKVSAGTHTITYTLANGYSGNASITAIDGKTISCSGLTFVIDDDKAGTDMKMEITVSGIEKSGYDTDPETHDEKASGLTTTEILLIVVVVIIAIMAVVLILRLNRS